MEPLQERNGGERALCGTAARTLTTPVPSDEHRKATPVFPSETRSWYTARTVKLDRYFSVIHKIPVRHCLALAAQSC
jgi:hypothetical protein